MGLDDDPMYSSFDGKLKTITGMKSDGKYPDISAHLLAAIIAII